MTMEKRVTLETVTVQREGKAYSPAIGATFSYSADELKFFEQYRPKATRAVDDETDGHLEPDPYQAGVVAGAEGASTDSDIAIDRVGTKRAEGAKPKPDKTEDL